MKPIKVLVVDDSILLMACSSTLVEMSVASTLVSHNL